MVFLRPARHQLPPRSTSDIVGPSPLVAIENEAAAELIVDPPLAEPLALWRVFIQYRADNMRVVPVFGIGALEVSPRIGHVHVTVDDAPWHFVDASGETVIVVGLKPRPAQDADRTGRSDPSGDRQPDGDFQVPPH